MRHRILIVISLVYLIGCRQHGSNSSPSSQNDSTTIDRLIKKGDRIYSQKSSYAGFLQSMELYDSAWQIANSSHDTSLIATTVFAKGRAYDAINNNPQKTIDYYKEAAKLYAILPGNYITSLYIKHLVAHSYDKVNDSINCVKILQELYNEIQRRPDSIKKQMHFTAEMALISTQVRNYDLADSTLTGLTKREWIKNEITEYDYLNHYYITKARLDVFKNKIFNSPYLDSVESVFTHSKNLSDSMYYSSQLWDLYKHTNNEKKENYYLGINNIIFNRFNPPQAVRQAIDKLSKLETASIEMQRNMEQQQADQRKKYIYVLMALLAVISALSLFLINRNKEIKQKRNEAIAMNNELLQKNLQNELLNKEIHHRVKNNLHMILSLVYMQEKKSRTDETKASLQDIRLRIENIAAMHQQLIEQNSDVVDLKKYVMQLVNSVASLVSNGQSVFTHLDIDEITISSKQSFPMGLLLNEWVTNSIKYANPSNEVMAVYISVKKENDKILIQYNDSGKAVNKENIQPGLGMNIINLLITQIDGELQRDETNYFKYKLTIPACGERN